MKKLILIAVPLCLASSALAQVNFTGTYSQDFNSLPTTGSTTWTNDSTLDGWFAATDLSTSVTNFGANTGSSTSGGLYSFGVAGVNPLTDRSFGMVASNGFTGASGSGKGYYGVILTNTSGSDLTNFQVSFRGEQYRKNDNANLQSVTFGYLVNPTATPAGLVAASTVDVGALSFGSPITGTGSLVLDGNATGNFTSLSSSLTGLTLAAGDSLLLRWTDLNDTGNDHFLSIDDLSVTSDAVPEPATMTILAGAAAMAAIRRKRK